MCLPHPDSTFPKGRSPLVVEAPMLHSVVSSVPIRLGRGGEGGAHLRPSVGKRMTVCMCLRALRIWAAVCRCLGS